MSSSPDDQAQALAPGEAYQRCMQELGKPYPDHQRAQLYATLSVEETLREVVAQIGDVAEQIRLASRP
jgi:hypothetical protein